MLRKLYKFVCIGCGWELFITEEMLEKTTTTINCNECTTWKAERTIMREDTSNTYAYWLDEEETNSDSAVPNKAAQRLS